MTSETPETKTETKTETATPAPEAAAPEAAQDEREEEEDEEDDDEDEDDDEIDDVEFEGTMPREEAASYLESLLAGLRAGHIEFRRGDRAMTLTLPSHVELEVEAKTKAGKGKGKIEIEITWRPTIQPLQISAASTAGPADVEGDDD